MYIVNDNDKLQYFLFFDTIFGIRGGIWVAGYGFAREQRCQNVVVAVEVEVGDTVVFMTRSVAILELLPLCLKAPKRILPSKEIHAPQSLRLLVRILHERSASITLFIRFVDLMFHIMRKR